MRWRSVQQGIWVIALMGLASPVLAQSRVNVIFRSGTSAVEQDRTLVRAGAARIQRLSAFNAVTATISGAARGALATSGSVVRVEDDHVVWAISQDGKGGKGKPGGGGAPPAQSVPTGVDRMDAEPGAAAPNTGSGRVVAIVDSGIDLDHPDLAANIVGDYNAINTSKTGNDDNGHGTHVAGTVAAINNSEGVIGVAPGAGLLAVKVLNKQGSGFSSDVAEGIDWAAANGADVINMSLGGPYNSLIEAAVRSAAASGIVIACAAGNEGPDPNTVGYPAKFIDCIAVAAWTDLDGTPAVVGGGDETVAAFSSRGPEVEVAAPGVDIRSTWKGAGYRDASGTSMASPHAAGALAILFAGGSSDPRGDLRAMVEAVSGTPEEVGAGLIRFGDLPPPNDPPVVAISSPSSGTTVDSETSITFAGTASDTEDGDLRGSLAWTSNINGPIGTGAGFSATLSDGNHTITATVTDLGGKSGSASVTITVGSGPAEPTIVSVVSITYATGGRKGRDLLITLALEDDFEDVVGGAFVAITLYLNGYSYAGGSATTGSGGTITFRLRSAPSGTYTTEVDDVVASGLSWDGGTPKNSFEK